MKRKTLSVAAILSVVLAAPAFTQTIVNPGFESDAAFANFPGYIQGNSPITGWTEAFPNHVGLNPGTSFNPFADNGLIPEGSRVAFIQRNDGGGGNSSLTTTITGLTPGSTYLLQFQA